MRETPRVLRVLGMTSLLTPAPLAPRRARALLTAIAVGTSLILLGACGGGGDGATAPPGGNPTPNPTPTPTPANLVIQAGDAQQGDPTAPLAIVPRVLVSDASGKPVPSVTVTFRVDSGGGIVANATATTASDGTASAGAWQLGPTEGRNVLTATVGSLPSVKFAATAVVTASTLTQQSIGTGGGTITVTRGVLNGAKIVIPNAALPAGNWTLEQKPVSAWPARPSVTPVGAILHIGSTNTDLATTPIQLSLPLPASPAGTKPFVIMRDAATGAMQVLQTVSSDNGAIVAATTHFDPAYLATASASAIAAAVQSVRLPSARASIAGLSSARGVSARFTNLFATQTVGSYNVDVVVANIPVSQLDGDVDTGFRPGVDDWDLPMIPVSFSTFLEAERDPHLDLGATKSQMIYYAVLKGQKGALNRRFRNIRDIPASNRLGYRWASISGAFSTHHLDYFASIRTIRTSMRAGQVDQAFYDVLKANLIVTGLPQFMVAGYANTWLPLTAFRVQSGRIEVANPYVSGATSTITFGNGAFQAGPMVMDFNGTTAAPEWVGATSIAQFEKIPYHVAEFLQVEDKSRDLFWPAAVLNARGGVVDDTSLVLVDDTTRFWYTCQECRVSTPSTLNSRGIEPFVGYVVDANGAVVSQFNGLTNIGALAQQTTATESKIGFVKFASPDARNVSWLDFEWKKVYKWLLKWPANLSAQTGVPTTLTIAVEGATTPAHTFRWTLGAGGNSRVLNSTGPSLDVTFSSTGEIPVMVEMIRTGDGQVIARSRSIVNAVARSWGGWRFTSFAVSISDNSRGRPHNGVASNTEWEYFQQFVAPSSLAARQFIERVVADSVDFFGIASGAKTGALIYLNKDTVSMSPAGDRRYNASKGLFWVTSPTIPTAQLVMAYGLDNLTKSLASPTQATREFGTAVANNAVKTAWRYQYDGPDDPLTSASSTVSGSAWANVLQTDGPSGSVTTEPRRRTSAQVTFNGETATGTIRIQYRLWPSAALTEELELPWTMTATFTATRIR